MPTDQPERGTTAPQRRLSVVIPVFNEEALVTELVERTRSSARSVGMPFEIVIVNDGSRDTTLARLVDMSMQIPELLVVDLRRNFGHMAALSAGLGVAIGDAVVVLDGDLQDPPELIPAPVREWLAGAEVVSALRSGRDDALIRRIAVGAFYRLLERISSIRIPQNVGTYGLMDRQVVDLIDALPERSRFFAGLRAWVGGRQATVSYHRDKRPRTRSRVGSLGLFNLAGVALSSFSRLPLRIASLLSLVCGLGLLTVGAGATVVRLSTHLAIPGWATYTTLIGLMGFVQSLVLAAISEYVGVIFEEVKGRPLYLARATYRGGRVHPSGFRSVSTGDEPGAADQQLAAK